MEDQKKDKPYIEQKSENPLYGAVDVSDAVFNRIYNRYVSQK